MLLPISAQLFVNEDEDQGLELLLLKRMDLKILVNSETSGPERESIVRAANRLSFARFVRLTGASQGAPSLKAGYLPSSHDQPSFLNPRHFSLYTYI